MPSCPNMAPAMGMPMAMPGMPGTMPAMPAMPGAMPVPGMMGMCLGCTECGLWLRDSCSAKRASVVRKEVSTYRERLFNVQNAKGF